MLPEAELKNKRVLIIGASSGMGKSVAKMAHAYGANVIMASRSLEKLERAKVNIGIDAQVIPVDMLEGNSVKVLFDTVETFDHLVITAVADETLLSSPIGAMSDEIAQRGMEKFWGTFHVGRAAVSKISATGSITLTSSISIFQPSGKGNSVMNAASGAVTAFGRAMAVELAPVRVNVLCPGVVNTGVWSDEQRVGMESWGRQQLPVRHLGNPDELAQSFIYLMTNTYTTGSVLVADGGLLLM